MTFPKRCVVLDDGSEIWLKDKKIHRDDGPAVIRKRDNYIGFWVEGKEYTPKSWYQKIGKKHITSAQLTFLLIKYNISLG